MSRPRLASLGVGLALGLLMATSGAAGGIGDGIGGGLGSERIVRWDFVQIVQGTGLAGGSVQATDAATGDVITLTGSGQANDVGRRGRALGRPARAAGGGRFVHGETEGIFLVTGFVSWDRDTGTIPVVDGIGFTEQASSGIMKLNVRLMPAGGSPVDGVLTIYCRLPGATFVPVEGIDLQVGSFDFKASGGVTLFHVLT